MIQLDVSQQWYCHLNLYYHPGNTIRMGSGYLEEFSMLERFDYWDKSWRFEGVLVTIWSRRL